jgi:acyl-CoA synthetase (AMP-forming)/AMP-acid ligase II
LPTNTILTLLSSERLAEHYAAGHWGNHTIYALASAHARKTPQKFAVRDRFRRLTYGELIEAVDALASDLAKHGVRPGQRVSIWLPSRVETAIVLLACSRNGYVCCPSIHRDHTVKEVVSLLARTRSAAFFTQPSYGADAERHDTFEAVAGLQHLKHVYHLPVLDPKGALPQPFESLQASSSPSAPSTDPNRVIYLAFTSGTTGIPKGVMHSDNTLLATVRTAIQDWELGPNSVAYSFSPLSHNLGIGTFITMMTSGGELVLHDLPKGSSWVDRLLETGATYLVGVPTHAIDLLSELNSRNGIKLPLVRGFRISGASVPSAVVAALLDRGIMPQSGYGMTETCSHQYTRPTDEPRLITETSGRACSGYELRIWRSDDPDREAAVGEVGEIGGRGASLMLGYFDDQAATEESFNSSGWFMTGDLGWMDENGYLRVTGRKKDVIVRGGHNIYPARIEGLALQHAAVERAAAFPMADPRLGEKVCLALEFRNGMTVSAEEILQHLDTVGLSKYDMPEYVLAPCTIPLTTSGKVLKRELVEWVNLGRVYPTPVRWQARS